MISPVDGRHAVVLGGAGFLGSHLSERLLQLGARVTAVDNLVTGQRRNVAHLDPSRFEVIAADIAAGPPSIDDVDYVLNLASPASPVDYLELPLETLRVGSYGTEAGLELARRNGARFLQASTSEVYGDPEIHPQPEDYWGRVNPIGPRSVYDEAKRYGEALVFAYRRTYGVDAAIARIFNTYGPRMRAADGRVVPAFIMAALHGRPLPIHGDGSQSRSLCFVADLIDGLIRLLLSDEAGPVNLGNEHEVSILDLAEVIQDVVGSHPGVEFHPRPEDDPTMRRPDTSLARARLGWAPLVPLRDGLGVTAEWFAQQLNGDASAKADSAISVVDLREEARVSGPESGPGEAAAPISKLG